MTILRALSHLAALYPKRRAFITGAASGLGRSLAMCLGAAGWALGINDIDEAGLENAARAVSSVGEQFPSTYAFDVTDEEAYSRAASAFLQQRGGLDLLFNNAGIGVGGSFVDTPLAHWREVLNVNLLGVVIGTKLFLPTLLQQRAGHIVNVASAAAFHALPRLSAYAASKAGVAALSEALRSELKGTGVRVTLKMATFYTGAEIAKHTRGSDEERRKAQALVDRGTLSADEAAEQLLCYVALNGFYAVYPGQARFLWAFKRHAPELYLRLMPSAFRRLDARLPQ